MRIDDTSNPSLFWRLLPAEVRTEIREKTLAKVRTAVGDKVDIEPEANSVNALAAFVAWGAGEILEERRSRRRMAKYFSHVPYEPNDSDMPPTKPADLQRWFEGK